MVCIKGILLEGSGDNGCTRFGVRFAKGRDAHADLLINRRVCFRDSR